MTTARAAERHFRIFARGDIRSDILTSWRVSLRTLTNPDTGLAFAEDEIAAATAEQSRFWIEADAIDLAMLSNQSNGLYLADQVRVRRAATAWLVSYHAEQWGIARLAATGGSGLADFGATPGAIFVGSTAIPDAAAFVATAPDGKRFQSMFTATTPGGGTASLTMRGVDTGDETNLDSGTELKPAANIPLGIVGNGATTAKFTGGAPVEGDADMADRIADRIKHKAASGNSAHMRDWARDASAAIDDAYIYPCALHAGTVIVSPAQRRGSVAGPSARIPSAGTLADAIAFLTPPGSPVVPTPPHVLVVAPVAEAADAVVSLAMPVGQAGGWADIEPWPSGTAATTITALTDQTNFQITIDASSSALPSGVLAPAMMVWDDATSRMASLAVQSVVLSAGLIYDVVLSAAPGKTLATGDYVSPNSKRRDVIAESAEEYLDSLGAGEVIDLATDPRGHRAFRFPEPSDEAPQRAGTSLLTFIADALGASLADSALQSISVATPTIPTDPTVGPSLIVAGKLALYPL